MSKKICEEKISEVYGKLRTFLVQKKCKVIAEEAPKSITVVQGSVWGTSAKMAQKKTTFTFMQDAEGTHISSTSVLTPRYINLTLAGFVFSAALLVVCVWIALNLGSYTEGGFQGFWGWLAQTQGNFDSSKASVFINVSWVLAAFLAVTLVAEAIIVWNIHTKIDSFAENALQAVTP